MKKRNWADLLERDFAINLLQRDSMPLRICVNGSNGYPVICSLWFKYENERLYCATNPEAVIAKCLGENPKCAFEISTNNPPYCGIRGAAEAKILPNGLDLLRSLLDRYIDKPDQRFSNWLLEKGKDDVIIELDAKSLYFWNYSDRMGLKGTTASL
jgi:hypothetical protein